MPNAFAGRPLTIDDAEPVPPRIFELEAGLRYEERTGSDHFDFPVALAYGVFNRVEVGLGFGGQLEQQEELQQNRLTTDVSDFVLGTKVKLLDAERSWASQALSFSVKFPTADENRGMGSGCVDYDLTWIASKPVGDKFGVHVNVGHTWVGADHDSELRDLLHYGLALDYQLTPSFQLVGEVFGVSSLGKGSETSVIINGGGRWTIRPNLVLDAAVGHTVHGPGAAVFGTIGLTWAFGAGL
ncbi:MAG TPA: transporter [Clostridia bacterium]|nr:transporter [Clostridia bacterium]